MAQMAGKGMPKRLKEFMRWAEQPHPTEAMLKKAKEYLGQISEEIGTLQCEAAIVEALSGFLTGRLPATHPEAHLLVPGADKKSSRIKAILRMAQILLEHGAAIIAPEDIRLKLKEEGISLDVKYPNSVIGNVLARSPKFRRLARNQFEYIGDREK